MTVATNALLEGRGARTALIATEGFTDLVELGRQDRAELYRLCAARPAPLVPDELRFGAPGADDARTGRSSRSTARAAGCAGQPARGAAEPEAVAVVLLHSYRHPEHELAVGEALARRACPTSTSRSRTRSWARSASTSAPRRPRSTPRSRRCCARYLRAPGRARRAERAPRARGDAVQRRPDRRRGGRRPRRLDRALRPGRRRRRAAFVARAAGAPDALCFDMGGTSCDVCVVDGGAVQERERRRRSPAGRWRCRCSTSHTVGAGGGSIAWRDAGRRAAGRARARRAPTRARRATGAAAREPTVTDANLVLGYLPRDAPLAGRRRARRARPRSARSARSRGELGLEPRAVRRGDRPRRQRRDGPGAARRDGRARDRPAPLRAARVRRRRAAARGGDRRRARDRHGSSARAPRGVLAALGLVVSPRRRDVQRTRAAERRRADRRGDRRAVASSARSARERARRAPTPSFARRYELRYRGQAFELAVDAGPSPTATSCARRSRPRTRSATATATRPGARARHDPRHRHGAGRRRRAGAARDGAARARGARQCSDGERRELEVAAGQPAAGNAIEGPAIFELPEATLLVPPGWSRRRSIETRHDRA